MSTLYEQLASIDPGIASKHCADFRTCLVAIAQRIQTEPECSMLSLNDWLQWLDDEGYEREGFAAILQQICEQELGDQACTDLWSHGRSIAAAADGIPNLITHVHSVHPGLEQRMTELEALALEEDIQIQHTAGGMTKAGKIALYSAVAVVGTAGIGVGIAKYRRRTAQRLERQIEVRYQELLDRAIEHERDGFDKTFENWLGKSGISKDLDRKYILDHDSIPLDFRLSELSESQVKECCHPLMQQLKAVHMSDGEYEVSKLGSEISTRLLKFSHPDVYVHAFKEWAQKSSKDLEDRILSSFHKPNDISMDLRHEFERSDHAAKFLKDLPYTEDEALNKMLGESGFRDTGLQHILYNKYVGDYYHDSLMRQRELIIKAKNEGALSPEMERLDTHLKSDFADETVRKMFDEIGDKVYQHTVGVQSPITAKFVDSYQEIRTRRFKFDFQDFAKTREAEEIIAKLSKENTAKIIIAESGKKVESEESKLLKKALRNLLSSPHDFGFYLKSIYIEERMSLDSRIKSTLEKEAKNLYVDELEKLDDVPEWIAKRDLKKDFETYLEADATKAFRDALDAAKKTIETSVNDAEQAAKDEERIL